MKIFICTLAGRKDVYIKADSWKHAERRAVSLSLIKGIKHTVDGELVAVYDETGKEIKVNAI